MKPQPITRRGFLSAGTVGAAVSAGESKRIRIRKAVTNFEREPLRSPFGFKGQYMTEKWQVATYLESESGHHAIGLCSQSVLWSDGEVFAAHSEVAGNALMYSMADQAACWVRGSVFRNPMELLRELVPRLRQYGVAVTGNPGLRETFVLMALVSLDFAAWLLYARENGLASFDEMLPACYRQDLSARHSRLAAVPLLSYSVPLARVGEIVRQGNFFLKIKLGAPGSQEEMLRTDKERFARIHRAVGHAENPYTRDGRLRYYLDANGRYERKETVQRFLDHARRIGALEQIALLEEPLPAENEERVDDLGVRVAADESAYTRKMVEARIQMGYSAVAIKVAAKTLSMSLEMIRTARARGIACFCADSTSIPILLDWGKLLAARLPALPCLRIGLLESNGPQNYRYWDRLLSYHPCAGASWIVPRKGVFRLDDDFYRRSGGIFLESSHYRGLFQ